MMQTLRCPQCSSTSLTQVGQQRYHCHHCGSTVVMAGQGQGQHQGQTSSQTPVVTSEADAARARTRTFVVLGMVAGMVVMGAGAGMLAFRQVNETSVFEPKPGEAPVPILAPGPEAAPGQIPAGPPEAPAEFGASAIQKPPTAAAKLEGFRPIPDSIGNVYFIGLVKNTGEAEIEQPKVEVALLDAKGGKAATAIGYAERDRIPPGEESPVKVLVQKAPKYKEFKLAINPAPSSYPRERVKLTFQDARLEPGSFRGYRLAGKVTHAQGKAASHVQVIALLLDKEKRIVGMESGFLGEDLLEPGESSPFQIDISLVKGEPASFRLYYDYLVPSK